MSAQDGNSDNCPSCNIPWVDHLGIQGVCRELQEYKTSHVLLVRAIREIAFILHEECAEESDENERILTAALNALAEAKKLTGDTK
jgi:hypothetical protein